MPLGVSPANPSKLLRYWVWAAALWVGCQEDITDYSALRLVISSEPPLQPGATISAVQLSLRAPDGAWKLPGTGKDVDLTFAIPPGRNIVTTPYTVDLTPPTGAAKNVQVRVVGVDGKAVLTTWSGLVDTGATGVVNVLLRAPQPTCDADGDGVADCAKAGCCTAGAASDCNDDGTKDAAGVPKGFAASPFGWEDPCTQCGNGVDEDCDGADAVCLDVDGDKVPDCQEAACGKGAETDPAVYPGAPEICDGKDNDCNQQVDDALATAEDPSPTHKAGEACGKGVCAGGQWQCASGGSTAAMVCSTNGKKAAQENCDNDLDDDCDGKTNQGCTLSDVDGDGFSNTVEKASCKYAFAMYHAEYQPNPKAAEKCCPAGAVDQDACDTNCDGSVTPCNAADKDGDGWAGSKDCDDADPLVYLGAPEKCGDGKVQGCSGTDPACGPDDKDGDGWLAPADCNDADKQVNPEAVELCNGVDDDCDGVVDDGNPEALDAKCGNLNGECGHKGGAYNQATGTLACKHYKFGQSPDDPLDCGTAFDAKTGTCIGCDGDQRPQVEVCDSLDNDCNAKTDEGFAYTQEDGVKLGIGAVCDGVGGCGKGVVECLNPATAACSSDANGSTSQAMAESCNNSDDNCNGQTDESLVAVGDSTCEKVGVCAANLAKIQTVCVAGKWRCDYSAVANVEVSAAECVPGSKACNCSGGAQKCHQMVEVSCDGLDNDCDGVEDDDFVYSDFDGASKLVGEGCLTGACAGGSVVCTSDKSTVTCNSTSKSLTEQCNLADDDCDGKTDEASDLPVEKSTCAQTGVCGAQNPVAKCALGQWTCEYTAIPGWESGKELTCDALDNDCDGQTDEDFGFNDLGQKRTKGQACGTGVCAGGITVCTSGKTSLTCSSLPNVATEVCDTLDNDCDAQTDEGFMYTQANGTQVAIGVACLGVGMCGTADGVVECLSKSAATCSSDANGSDSQVQPEICDDQDNDCDGTTDEGCDGDGDGWCTTALTVVGTPAVCPQGGGDCAANVAEVHPTQKELCDGIDNDCSGTTDEGFAYADPGQVSSGIGAGCGLGACKGGTVVCAGTVAASCSTLGALKPETCNGQDDDCNGVTDDGCDDDADGFCDVNMGWEAGAAVTCVKTSSLQTLDCDDAVKTTSPASPEACNGVDDNCSAQTDEGCDTDGDQYCDAGMGWSSGAVACPLSTSASLLDCDDEVAVVNPGVGEKCNGVDDNCVSGKDEGCDDDSDGYCDAAMTVTGTPAVCPSGGGDCQDQVGDVHPDAVEVCDNVDNNCTLGTDEGCDDDDDTWCDAAMLTVGKPATCAQGGGDCNDLSGDIHPGVAKDLCASAGVDDNCDGVTDASGSGGCTDFYTDVDNDTWGTGAANCLCVANVVLHLTALKLGDCADANGQIHPGVTTDTCATAGIDDNCDGQTDPIAADACTVYYKDADADTYGTAESQCTCAADQAAKFTAAEEGDCNDANGAVNPGVTTDLCASAGVDDNCDGQTDPKNATGCTTYYLDGDEDGFGDTGTAPQCLCATVGKYTATVGGDCNDADNKVKPGALETCNGVDDDCNGTKDVPDSAQCVNYYVDSDGDGYGALGSSASCLCAPDTVNDMDAVVAGDCNDAVFAIKPGAAESCNGVDDNCAGGIDEGVKTTYYPDVDSDGYGNGASPVEACSPPTNFVTNATDCNDNVFAVHPTATETCNDVDDNCVNGKDETWPKLGESCGVGACGGGKLVCKGDGSGPECSTASVALPEACSNSVDDDCNGETDETGCTP